MKLYLAGPMRGYPNFNFDMFDKVAARLRYLRFDVVSPAEHDRETGFDETANTLDGFNVRDAFLWDIEQVIDCDAIVLLPGWAGSTGAQIEYAVAKMFGQTIYAWELCYNWHEPAEVTA